MGDYPLFDLSYRRQGGFLCHRVIVAIYAMVIIIGVPASYWLRGDDPRSSGKDFSSKSFNVTVSKNIVIDDVAKKVESLIGRIVRSSHSVIDFFFDYMPMKGVRERNYDVIGSGLAGDYFSAFQNSWRFPRRDFRKIWNQTKFTRNFNNYRGSFPVIFEDKFKLWKVGPDVDCISGTQIRSINYHGKEYRHFCLNSGIGAISSGISSSSGGDDVLLEMRELILRLDKQSTSVFNKEGGNTEKQSSEYNKQFIMVAVEPAPRGNEASPETEEDKAAKSGALVLIGLLIGGIVAYLIINCPFEKRNKDKANEHND